MNPTSADITIVGLGPAGLQLLTSESQELLRHAPRLIARTEKHPAVAELREQGVTVETLDEYYQRAESFEQLYPTLAEAVLRSANQGPVVYAVPGHPLLGEESVRLLLRRAAEAGRSTRVLAALSFVDVVASALATTGEIPDLTQWQVVDALALTRIWWNPEQPTLVFQVDDQAAASRMKLAAQEDYPDEFRVAIVRRAGEPSAEVRWLPLYQLDRPEAGEYDHLTTVYLPPLPPEERRPDFARFVDVVAALRAPEGCPWDREQTYKSLRRYVLEEAYEVLEAIDSEDPDRLAEELGDLLLQVLMLSQIGSEEGYFDVRDVIQNVVEKLIRRHPHVFGEVSVADTDEVLRNWDAIKQAEKPERTSVLDGVPKDLPALMKALEVSKRAVKVGFEWPDLDAVLAKLDEEVSELKAEIGERNRDRLRAELGDLLFTVVNVARWLKIDPEEALREMVKRFGHRFRHMEAEVAASGRRLSELDSAELDRLWEQAKAEQAK